MIDLKLRDIGCDTISQYESEFVLQYQKIWEFVTDGFSHLFDPIDFSRIFRPYLVLFGSVFTSKQEYTRDYISDVAAVAVCAEVIRRLSRIISKYLGKPWDYEDVAWSYSSKDHPTIHEKYRWEKECPDMDSRMGNMAEIIKLRNSDPIVIEGNTKGTTDIGPIVFDSVGSRQDLYVGEDFGTCTGIDIFRRLGNLEDDIDPRIIWRRKYDIIDVVALFGGAVELFNTIMFSYTDEIYFENVVLREDLHRLLYVIRNTFMCRDSAREFRKSIQIIRFIMGGPVGRFLDSYLTIGAYMSGVRDRYVGKSCLTDYLHKIGKSHIYCWEFSDTYILFRGKLNVGYNDDFIQEFFKVNYNPFIERLLDTLSERKLNNFKSASSEKRRVMFNKLLEKNKGSMASTFRRSEDSLLKDLDSVVFDSSVEVFSHDLVQFFDFTYRLYLCTQY